MEEEWIPDNKKRREKDQPSELISNEEGSKFCKNCNEPLHLQAFCPYCGSWLKKRPKRKSKCPICSNSIYVRNGKLFTLDELTVKDFLERFEYLGIDKSYFEETRITLKKRFRTEPSSHDVIWGILNELIIKHANDYYTLSRLYYELAFIANKEKREFFHLLQKSMEMTLRCKMKEMLEIGISEKVEIFSSGFDDMCEECSKLNGKIFGIKDALRQMPIPNRNCTTSLEGGKKGFCRCSYLIHIDV